MRTFLAIIGALAIGVVGLFGVLVIIGVQRAGPVLEEAHAYADESVPAITSEWNGDELWSRAAPELKELLRNGGLEQLMSAGSFQLGRLVNYNPAECTLTGYELGTEEGETALAQCAGKAEYEKAIAGYTLNVLKREGEWKILGFYVLAEEATDQPVMVSYRPAPKPAQKSVGLSWRKLSVGVSTVDGREAGAEIRTGSKIENID